MGLSIGQVAKQTGLSEYTLRYYDQQGLLPNIERTSSGRRHFDKDDLDLLDLIACLKSTGMTLDEIRGFVNMTEAGDSTLESRLAVFRRQRAVVQKQIEDAQRRFAKLDYKVRYFEAACAAGTEAAVEGDCDHPQSAIRINESLRVKK